jgi:hypothetical protein
MGQLLAQNGHRKYFTHLHPHHWAPHQGIAHHSHNGLPKKANIISVDAEAMYSNIDTDHEVQVLKLWLCLYRNELPPSMQVNFVVEALEEIMKNNIFQFGNTYWQQKRGCTMGTSTSIDYAYIYIYIYIYIGLLEVKRLLPHYKNNLLFLKCFINNGIGVWIDTPHKPLPCNSFLRALNNWGTLKWTCDGHQDALVFLNLPISIDAKHNLFFKSYQKPMYLYLYILPTSAHPSMAWPARHKNGGHEQVMPNARETNYQPDNVSPAILDFTKL